VAEAARIISDAVDPDANIISGMVIDPTLDEAMKVTVIATGFDRSGEDRPRPPMPQININRPAPVPNLAALPINDRERQDRAERDREEPEKEKVDVPFYRKVIANVRGDDPNGFGPNWSNVDDYDIPTVLRKQMD
jgi:cell division GTPase FtsZ